jgi:mitochondrial fission protein ELM1
MTVHSISSADRTTASHQPAPSTVWILADDRPGNTTQSLGLARALGWPYEVKELHFTSAARWLKRLVGAGLATCFGLDRARSAVLAPPWPSVVITAGWRPAPVARWIGKQSYGRTRVIQMGRKGGHVAGLFDVVISCSYFRLPPHPRRIEIAVPLTQVAPERLTQAGERWGRLFTHAPHPHIMVIVGGTSKRHHWNPEVARRMGEAVRAFAQTARGFVFAITSRRTGAEATTALKTALGEWGHVHEWQPGQQDNPYFAYLALADVLVVTGESESMLAEAATVGKPVYIYPLPERPPQRKAKAWVKDWVVAHAYIRPTSIAGRQLLAWWPQGLSSLCIFLIASGLVRPRRDLNELHEALIRLGIAQRFGEPLVLESRPTLQEADDVARRVRRLLGFMDP